MYNFKEQMKLGDEGEQKLDQFLCTNYDIVAATKEQQRSGIDRLLTHKVGKETLSVEYKTDYKSAKTGNAYIETVAYKSPSSMKLGWAATCTADYILYFVYPKKVYILSPQAIKNSLDDWSSKYRLHTVRNTGFYGQGIILPLTELDTKFQVVNVEDIIFVNFTKESQYDTEKDAQILSQLVMGWK